MITSDKKRLLLVLVFAVSQFHTRGQGTFINMNFESANVPIIPNGQAGTDVGVTEGIPGWLAYLGSSQTSQMLHNDISIFSARVGILGPDWNNSFGIGVIEGNYSAVIQAGQSSLDPISASISQTGQFPGSAKSIRLKTKLIFADPANQFQQFELKIAGQNVALLPLSVTSGYTLFGGDISAFAGLTGELKISATPTPYEYYSFVVDSIVFSNQPIPEPSVFGLVGLGALLFGLRLRRMLKS